MQMHGIGSRAILCVHAVIDVNLYFIVGAKRYVSTKVNGSFPPTETGSDSDHWDGDPSLKWVQ